MTFLVLLPTLLKLCQQLASSMVLLKQLLELCSPALLMRTLLQLSAASPNAFIPWGSSREQQKASC